MSTEETRGYHEQARSVIKDHAVEHKRDISNDKTQFHQATVSSEGKRAIHGKLTRRGFKHAVSLGVDYYDKGYTNVEVTHKKDSNGNHEVTTRTHKPVQESVMEKQDILRAILSKDAAKLAEAKGAIKALLDARAAQFRADSSKFVAKSLFESAGEAPFKEGEEVNTRHVGSGVVHSVTDHEVTVKVPNNEPGAVTRYKMYRMPHSHASKVVK